MAHIFAVTVTDAEYKALNLVVPNADEWVEDAIRDKIRRCKNRLVEEHSNNPDLLSQQDQAEVQQDLVNAGAIMKSPKEWPDAVKNKVIERTTMKTRVERDSEELQKLINP